MSNVKQVFQEINDALSRDPKYAEGVNAVYQFNLTDEDPGIYQLILKNDHRSTAEGEKEQADCTLHMKAEDFVQMAEGKLNGTQAFMSGKLKIKGNMGLALKLQSILATYNKEKSK